MAQLQWTDPEWLAAADEWIRAELSAAGRSITGDATQPHIRPWSTAIRTPTDRGPAWFKAGTSALAHEAALTAFLVPFMPGHLPSVISRRDDLGWMLLEDLGGKLRERINGPSDLHWWHEVTGIYADLQQQVAGRLEDLAATGIPDRRRASLKHRWDALVGDTAALMIDQPDGLTSARHRKALTMWPEVDALIEESECAGLPYTVVHEDLHDANVFLSGERLVIADWGDSSIANPLSTLTVLLNSAAHHRGLAVRDAPIAAIRDRYLERWREYADGDVLIRAADAATRLGMLHRSLCWREAIRSAPADLTVEYVEAVPGWLDEFISTFDP